MDSTPQPVLPTLRGELALLPGPPDVDGAPTWILHDPARHRFYRLGWMERAILSHWDLGFPDRIAEAVNRQTTLQITEEQVVAFLRFLDGNDLIRRSGEAGLQRLLQAFLQDHRLAPADLYPLVGGQMGRTPGLYGTQFRSN